MSGPYQGRHGGGPGWAGPGRPSGGSPAPSWRGPGGGPPAPPPPRSDDTTATGSTRAGPGAPAGASGAPDGGAGDGSSTSTSELAGSEGFASRPPRQQRDSTPQPRTSAGAGRHRRDGAPEDLDDGADGDADTGSGRGSRQDEGGPGRKKKKRKGSFWRELPLLIVVALVLTFVIQTFLGRIYVIPSASMEQTLHGCTGCVNDRVAVDKLTYRFNDPAPGDVVVFRGPPTWASNDEVDGERSDNVLVRGLQQAASLIGLAPPDEKDFVKRVIAVGGQTVACCDQQNRVTVDGRPLTEPYIYYQPQLGQGQAPFDPVQVPDGQLWVMGDNRNNSSDARAHGPIGVTDVIGKARAIVLPVNRWGGVADTDPQAQPSALGAPGWSGGLPAVAGLLLAVPAVRGGRRLRLGSAVATTTGEPPEHGPDPAASDPLAPDAVAPDAVAPDAVAPDAVAGDPAGHRTRGRS